MDQHTCVICTTEVSLTTLFAESTAATNGISVLLLAKNVGAYLEELASQLNPSYLCRSCLSTTVLPVSSEILSEDDIQSSPGSNLLLISLSALENSARNLQEKFRKLLEQVKKLGLATKELQIINNEYQDDGVEQGSDYGLIEAMLNDYPCSPAPSTEALADFDIHNEKQPKLRGRKKKREKHMEKDGNEGITEDFPTIFKCHVCHKILAGQIHLKNHLLIHTNERPYECKTCLKRFRHQAALCVHSMRHKGILPHKCSICGKGFTTKWHKDIHEVTHTSSGNRSKDFLCQFCPNSYSSNLYLKHHLRNVHPEARSSNYDPDNIPRCSFCDKTFLHQNRLNNHVLNKHQQESKKFECAKCGRKFCNGRGLDRHTRNVHGKNRDEDRKAPQVVCHICSKKLSALSIRAHLKRHDPSAKAQPAQEGQNGQMKTLIRLKRRWRKAKAVAPKSTTALDMGTEWDSEDFEYGIEKLREFGISRDVKIILDRLIKTEPSRDAYN